jgi:diguanylate cyclase (GGDEF)-like protein/PAS domain S-box-containing protein
VSGEGAVAAEAKNVNLPENAGCSEQQQVLDALPVLVFVERAGKIVFVNAEARLLLGLGDGEWLGRPVEEVLWGLFPGTAAPQTQLAGTRKGSSFHATVPAKNGRLVAVEGTYSLFNPERREGVIVAQPGGREKAPRSHLVEDVLASISEAVAIQHGGHVLYANPAFTALFGYSADEACGGSLRELIVPETRLNENAALLRTVDEQGRAQVETVRMAKSGELVDVSLQISPLLVDGAKVGYVFSYRDIGEHKEMEAKLQHDAMHDVLTGLPNRALFLDRLTLALSRRVRRPNLSCGVLYLDLDRFKEINDNLGHAAGDVVLKTVAERLRKVLRPQDSAARLGGDEFAVLVENILTVADLEVVAERILRELQRPFEVFGQQIQSDASIGGAMDGAHHSSPEQLMRNADFAMYSAKQEGGAHFEIFDKHLEISLTSQQERERELRRVLAQRQFEFRFQPVYRLADGRLEGFETTLCWRPPDGPVEDFDDLMAVADASGLSIPLAQETMENACRQLRVWSDTLPALDLFVGVNLSPRQFFYADLPAQLMSALAATGADPSRLVLEVPEAVLNEDPDAAVAILQRLVDCQVRVAMDDFGSSLAPLNHWVRLPIAIVKFDKKMALAAARASRQQSVLETLVRLGETLGVHVVAQGIETADEAEAFCRMGCPSGEGSLLSPPLELAEARELAEAAALRAARRP